MRVARRHSLSGVLALSALLVLAGCGSDKKASETTTSTSTPSSTTTVTFPPVKLGEGSDAQGRISNMLFAGRWIAQYVKDTGNKARDLDRLRTEMKHQYPKVKVVGPTVTATPTQVSALSGTLVANQPPGAKNPYTLTFAVMDTAGKCVGATSYGYPVLGKDLVSFINAEIGACNAGNALKYSDHLIPH